jgi:hypothetical protein
MVGIVIEAPGRIYHSWYSANKINFNIYLAFKQQPNNSVGIAHTTKSNLLFNVFSIEISMHFIWHILNAYVLYLRMQGLQLAEVSANKTAMPPF